MAVSEKMAVAEKPSGSKPVSAKGRTQALVFQGRIETDIIQGRFKAGERLDESRLAQRFGVSRTPIREALKGLAVARLVIIRPHAGGVPSSSPSYGRGSGGP
jgi:DNA-binding GntR family transcriptional regulator